jgi:hypothetical protein
VKSDPSWWNALDFERQDRSEERKLDFEFGGDWRISGPGGFKSFISREEDGWTAHIKVDFDVDFNTPIEAGTRRAGRFLHRRGFLFRAILAYRTRKGLHLRVWVKHPSGMRLSARQVLALQDMLGDDPSRSKFNHERVDEAKERWNVLFTGKYHNARPISGEIRDEEWTRRFVRWFGG